MYNGIPIYKLGYPGFGKSRTGCDLRGQLLSPSGSLIQSSRVADTNYQNAVVGLDDIDDEMRAVGMDANRRRDLGTLTGYPRIGRKRLEHTLEPSVIGLRLVDAEGANALDIDRDDVLLGGA